MSIRLGTVERLGGNDDGLASEPGSYAVAIHAQVGSRDRYMWVRFVPLSADVMLVSDGDEYRVAYHPGHRPDWIGMGRRPVETEPQPVTRPGP